MSILFDDVSLEYLESNTAVNISSAGFSVAAWAYVDDLSVEDKIILWIGDKDVSNKYYRLMYDVSSGGCQFSARNTTSKDVSVGTVSANTWHHFGGMEVSTSSRFAVLDGVISAENASASSFNTAMDRTTIGRMADSSPKSYMSGRVEHVAIWDAVLTQGEWISLSKGYEPRLIRRQSLVHYWPLPGVSDITDRIGNLNLSAFNTPVDAPNTRIIQQSAQILQFPPVAAAGGGFQPAWATRQSQIIGAGVR